MHDPLPVSDSCVKSCVWLCLSFSATSCAITDRWLVNRRRFSSKFESKFVFVWHCFFWHICFSTFFPAHFSHICQHTFRRVCFQLFFWHVSQDMFLPHGVPARWIQAIDPENRSRTIDPPNRSNQSIIKHCRPRSATHSAQSAHKR